MLPANIVDALALEAFCANCKVKLPVALHTIVPVITVYAAVTAVTAAVR